MPPSESIAASSDVSVVIPAFNAASTVAETINAVLGQSHRPAQIVVVDDGSTDDTAAVAAQFGPKVRVISQKNAGPAAARNAGILACNTSFVAFTDSDCRPNEDWIAELLSGFDAEEVAGVGGNVRGINNDSISQYVDFSRMLQPGVGPCGVENIVTANACFRRKVLLDVGLFSTRFRKPGGEEPELCERIRSKGYVFREVERAIVYHHHKQTLRVLLKTVSNYGRGRYTLAASVPKYVWSNHPRLLLIRNSLGLRLFLARLAQHRRTIGLRKAITFAGLAYLCDIAFIGGYLREQRERS